jgi:hypothetical protein
MTEGRLEDLEIRKAHTHKNTEHLVADIGSARAHISIADEQACITVHDGGQQASIILNDSEDITTVTHEDDVDVVDRTGSLVDPLASTD